MENVSVRNETSAVGTLLYYANGRYRTKRLCVYAYNILVINKSSQLLYRHVCSLTLKLPATPRVDNGLPRRLTVRPKEPTDEHLTGSRVHFLTRVRCT